MCLPPLLPCAVSELVREVVMKEEESPSYRAANGVLTWGGEKGGMISGCSVY